MKKKVAILQSNYIPWKGYFDLINMVDEFIIFDTVQYTKNDWRNRNKIKTTLGTQWLTIPVRQEKLQQTIQETKIQDKNWNKKHWNTIKHNYAKAECFKEQQDFLEDVYLNANQSYLSEVNYYFILAVNSFLGINTKITWSSDYNIIDGKTERLIDLCKQANATEYISGPAAKNYIDSELFKKENIKLSWIDYGGYKEYQQLHPPFEHGVSIVDMILNLGKGTNNYMNSN